MPTKLNDEIIRKVISNILNIGLMLTVLLMCIGGPIYLAQHGLEMPENGIFHGEPTTLRNVSGITTGAFYGRGQYLIQLGVLILIATPILRVAFTVVAFARQRDYVYAGICMTVLSVIGFSFWGAV